MSVAEDNMLGASKPIQISLVSSPDRPISDTPVDFIIRVKNQEEKPIVFEFVEKNYFNESNDILKYNFINNDTHKILTENHLSLNPYEFIDIKLSIYENTKSDKSTRYTLLFDALNNDNYSISNTLRIESISSDPNEFR
jgi:hypothetical protein